MSIVKPFSGKAIFRASSLSFFSKPILGKPLTKPITRIISTLSLPFIFLAAPACAQESDPSEARDELLQNAPDAEAQDNGAPEITDIVPQFDPDAPEAPIAEPSAAALASLDMIGKALKEIDDTIERDGNGWQFQLEGTQIIVISDPLAERMRIMVPIIQADSLSQELLGRVMQANFDSALDARYAIANGLLWGTYIHPLTGLSEEEFLSGLGQTISIVQTFGTSFSSGEVVFGGGDSQGIVEEQIEEQEKEREEASFT